MILIVADMGPVNLIQIGCIEVLARHLRHPRKVRIRACVGKRQQQRVEIGERRTVFGTSSRTSHFVPCAITKFTNSRDSKNDGEALCPSPGMSFVVICPPPAS